MQEPPISRETPPSGKRKRARLTGTPPRRAQKPPRRPVYAYRPHSEVPPNPVAPSSTQPRQYKIYALAAVAFAIVTALAFWDGFDAVQPNEPEESLGEVYNGPAAWDAAGGGAFDSGDEATGISIVTFPTEANVAIEFDPVGTSPLDPIPLDPGSYFISVSKPGYTSLDTLVFVDAGRMSPVYVLLRRDGTQDGAAVGAIADAPTSAEQRRDPVAMSERRPSPAPAPSQASRGEGRTRSTERTTRPAPDAVRRASARPLNRNEPSSPELPSTGSVSVRSTPSGATVLLNGQPLGTTPTTLHRVTPDEYTLGLELGGFVAHTERVDVRPGEQASVRAALVPSTGEIEVVVRPWGSIYIDGTLRRADTDVAFQTTVSAGTRAVRVTHPSLGSQERTVDVPAGGSKRVVIDLNEFR